ncbi:MAG TPA: hypothetical protein VGK22_05550 [Candidatus Angelobacter sp.]|jgi:hypothetical protein
MIRAFFFFLFVFTASALFAQNCTAYVLVDPFDTKTGMGIDNLTAENFSAKIDGLSLPIVSATQRFNNRLLVLIEVRGNTDPKQMEPTIQGIVGRAPAGRPIAFGVFSEEAFISEEFSDDHKRRSAAIHELVTKAAQLPGKDSALFDSLHQAIAAFGPHQPGDTILLVTEGKDYTSKRSPTDLTKEFAASGTRLLVVIEPNPNPANRDFAQHSRESDRALKLLTSSTGGAYKEQSYGRILEFAWAGYILGIQIPNTLNNPKEWKLELKNTNGRTNKHSFLYFPWKLRPCSGTAMAVR